MHRLWQLLLVFFVRTVYGFWWVLLPLVCFFYQGVRLCTELRSCKSSRVMKFSFVFTIRRVVKSIVARSKRTWWACFCDLLYKCKKHNIETQHSVGVQLIGDLKNVEPVSTRSPQIFAITLSFVSKLTASLYVLILITKCQYIKMTPWHIAVTVV